ncbi:MAG TPA: hypothetical protein VFO65_01290 [Acidimicrobiales bacterium]|nr:hypothetical protein [Acidimicrobiales bacterium]
MRRRKNGFPRAGDRIRFAVPLPSGHEPRVRFGTVLERSCGRSSALFVRWEPEGKDGVVAETWLPDAGWHWSRAHIRLAHADERRALGAPTAAAAAASVDPTSITPVRRAMRHRVAADSVGPDGGMDAAAEWDAALEADSWLTTDQDWAALLDSALAPMDDFDLTAPPLPLAPPPAPPAPAPAPPASIPVPSAPPAGAYAPGPAAAPYVPYAPAPAPAPPAPAPAPAPAAAVPPAPRPQPAPEPEPDVLGDIVPGRGRRR